MRFIIIGFLSLLIWGYVSWTAGSAGIAKWIAAVSLLLIGFVFQVIYARLVNRHLDAVAIPESVCVRLRNDRGIVPFWISGTGILSRSLLVAGTVWFLLETFGR
jgi:hypothetical protein